MGSKGTKPAKLSSKDRKFLMKQTGYSQEEVENIFAFFSERNPDAVLNREEFTRLYNELRPEPAELLDEMMGYIFGAFDIDDNGTINFKEFMISYAMTSRGDPHEKLEYAFDLYDVDETGTLDRSELRNVIVGMLDMLGAEKRGIGHAEDLANNCLEKLDDSSDGTITKEEFVEGLLEDYSMRAVMSPFN